MKVALPCTNDVTNERVHDLPVSSPPGHVNNLKRITKRRLCLGAFVGIEYQVINHVTATVGRNTNRDMGNGAKTAGGDGSSGGGGRKVAAPPVSQKYLQYNHKNYRSYVATF